MTDDALKDLVLKHDGTINNLTIDVQKLTQSIATQADSIQDLVVSNKNTNERLKEISEYLAKQSVFDTKLSSMDKELTDSFKRVHHRIDILENIQGSNDGCKSVQLLHKDVEALAQTVTHLAGNIGDVKIAHDATDSKVEALPSPRVMMWIGGMLIVYTLSFGTYVIKQLHGEEVMMTKINDDVKYLKKNMK